MARVSYRRRLRYWFDNTMSKGTPALIGWLGLLSAALIVIIAALVLTFVPKTGNVPHVLWLSLLRAMDPGTVAGDQGSTLYLGLMLAVTVGGIFILSALIGVLTAGLEARMAELRKGRSQVIESDHTVLIGWSDQVFTVVSELVKANESRRRACIAILADLDKVEMEDEIRAKVGDTGKTRVVCRTGDPADPDDLEIVSPATARSVVVLSRNSDNPDAQVIKSLLALSKHSPRRRGKQQVPVLVAAVSDSANLGAARLAGGPSALVVDADDIAARLVVQTSRQSGLSVVCTDLLDFDGDELYVTAVPRLAGRTFGEALFSFRTSSLVGISHPDGTHVLNPPDTTTIRPDDQMILISEDDDAVEYAPRQGMIDPSLIATRRQVRPAPERTLLLGWNDRAPMIIDQLDRYVPRGSMLNIVTEHTDAPTEIDRLSTQVANMALNLKEADTTSRPVLESLDVHAHDQVIVLSSGTVDVQEADSRTLVTLLHLRDMETRLGHRYTIVSEIGDDRNRILAQIANADDFIVSEKLISLLLTQMSEDRRLGRIFADLFDPRGSEIYLKPATDFVPAGQPVDFYTVLEAGRRYNEIAIGYRIQAAAHTAPAFGVVLNPDKSEQITFSADDRVIVLAED